jgi:hypothetical protein
VKKKFQKFQDTELDNNFFYWEFWQNVGMIIISVYIQGFLIILQLSV